MTYNTAKEIVDKEIEEFEVKFYTRLSEIAGLSHFSAHIHWNSCDVSKQSLIKHKQDSYFITRHRFKFKLLFDTFLTGEKVGIRLCTGEFQTEKQLFTVNDFNDFFLRLFPTNTYFYKSWYQIPCDKSAIVATESAIKLIEKKIIKFPPKHVEVKPELRNLIEKHNRKYIQLLRKNEKKLKRLNDAFSGGLNGFEYVYARAVKMANHDLRQKARDERIRE